MAEPVIDRLKTIQVEHENRELRVVASAPRHGLLHLQCELGAIGQAGQGVVMRQLFQGHFASLQALNTVCHRQ